MPLQKKSTNAPFNIVDYIYFIFLKPFITIQTTTITDDFLPKYHKNIKKYKIEIYWIVIMIRNSQKNKKPILLPQVRNQKIFIIVANI